MDKPKITIINNQPGSVTAIAIYMYRGMLVYGECVRQKHFFYTALLLDAIDTRCIMWCYRYSGKRRRRRNTMPARVYCVPVTEQPAIKLNGICVPHAVTTLPLEQAVYHLGLSMGIYVQAEISVPQRVKDCRYVRRYRTTFIYIVRLFT